MLSRDLEFGHVVGKGERQGIREGQWLVARTQRQKKVFRNSICWFSEEMKESWDAEFEM